MYQPQISEIETGFSVSAWLQPELDVDGFVLAKTSNDGATYFYTLKLQADSSQFILTYGYSLIDRKHKAMVNVLQDNCYSDYYKKC